MSEVTLVACAAPHFALQVTNLKVVIVRRGPTGEDTVAAQLHGLSDVRLDRLVPWGAVTLAALAIAGFAVPFAFDPSSLGNAAVLPLFALLIAIAGFTRRRRLSFVSVGKRYRLAEPRTINVALRARVRSALVEAARLLADPAAREAAVREKLAQLPAVEGGIAAAPIAAASVESDDDRRLCPDGACTGLVGGDGRCRVCGKSAA